MYSTVFPLFIPFSDSLGCVPVPGLGYPTFISPRFSGAEAIVRIENGGGTENLSVWLSEVIRNCMWSPDGGNTDTPCTNRE